MVEIDWFHAGDASTILDLSLLKEPRHGMRDPVVVSLIQALLRENDLGSPNGLAYTESLILAIIYSLSASSIVHDSRRKKDTAETGLQRGLDYIHQNLAMEISIREIAVASGFFGNLYSFSKFFRRRTGRPPHQYILNARLEMARTLLSTGGLSVTDVAHSCGFKNLSHFSDTFRKRWGVPPSLVRTR